MNAHFAKALPIIGVAVFIYLVIGLLPKLGVDLATAYLIVVVAILALFVNLVGPGVLRWLLVALILLLILHFLSPGFLPGIKAWIVSLSDVSAPSLSWELAGGQWWKWAVPLSIILVILIMILLQTKLPASTRAALFVAGAVLTLVVWAIILPGVTNITRSTPATASRPVERQEWGAAVAPTSPCNSREQPYLFEAQKPAIPFNRAGQCSAALWIQGHCVWALGYLSRKPVKVCDFGKGLIGEFPVSMEYVWSADSPFQNKYRLDPPNYTHAIVIR